MSHSATPRALVRVLWGFIAALLAAALVATPAEPAGEELEVVGSLPIRYPKGVDTGGANAGIIINSSLRLGYQFFVSSLDTSTIGRVLDLDTQRVLVERTLPRQYFPSGPIAPSVVAFSGEWVHAVDPEAGDLYLGAQDNARPGGFHGIARLDPRTLAIKAFFPWEAVTYKPNVSVDPDDPELPCTANACLPQVPTATPSLRGLAFSETYLTGLTNKLLLLMNENINGPNVENNFSVAWVAQWDAETGNQDWINRSAACSNSAYPGRDAGIFRLGIFQARLGSGIYIGCQSSGGTGQVVRIPVDGQNTPIPNAEQAFPGPQSVVDAIPDPASDRMILRVQNEDGDSYWVFDGPSSSYAGVIGSTKSRVTAIAAGLDETSGRLYMLAPPTVKDGQEHDGGLMISDIRRSPAPQFLTYDEYAGQWEGTIRVDVNPTTGERMVYAHRKEAKAFEIIRDGVPISQDPPILDQDRLTVDVEEKDGVTGRNFTGAGHAYGLRLVLAGGLEGFPPTGPDAGGIRVGRYTPYMLGSPCGEGNRELVIGSVDQAGLSNNLASAGASVGNADPGTKTDIGEPSARCYPRPRDLNGRDVWTTELPAGVGSLEDRTGRTYPEPLKQDLDDEKTGSANEPRTDADEVLGNTWPFFPTQCSEDETGSSTTALRPLDRGDTETGPIPPDQRKQEVVVEGSRAEVMCSQKNARVSAFAEFVVGDEDVPALEADVPRFGKIRVAEVSAASVIYIDANRGLVSRSISMARGISLGDHVYIDATIAIAEAWAAGRPGTAGTDFQRFICGVRTKDEASDTKVYRPNAGVVTPPTDDPTSWDPSTAVSVDPQGGSEIQKFVSKSACGDPDEPQVFGPLRSYAGVDDTQPLIDVINRALGNRGRVSSPKPDGQLSQGTPGGYLASVQKDRLNEISSRAVNNDPSTQVPALELLVFNDDRNQGRGRQVYQFAGVDASVTYGIYLLNPEEIDPCLLTPGCFEDAIDDFVPDSPIGDDLPPPEVPDQPPPHQGPLKMLFSGVNFLLRSPIDAMLAAAVWAILFAPVQLSARRRALRGLA